MMTPPNDRTAPSPATASTVKIEHYWREVGEPDHWAALRALQQNTPQSSQIMKKQIIIVIACMAAAFTFTGCLHTSRAAAQPDRQLQYTLRVTPEIKRAFHSDDSIK